MIYCSSMILLLSYLFIHIILILMYLPIHMSPSLYIYLNISSSQYHILSDPVFGFVALHNVCDAGVSILSFRYNVHLG